jgi:hypothetical protein
MAPLYPLTTSPAGLYMRTDLAAFIVRMLVGSVENKLQARGATRVVHTISFYHSAVSSST